VLDIQDAFDKGASFADCAQFENSALKWQDELGAQRVSAPSQGVVSGPPAH